MKAFDAARHCGAKTRAGTPCTQVKGHRTDHPGADRCWLHGGRSPGGRKQGKRTQAAQLVAKLGIPAGTGDPMVLLTKAVQHAEGFLEATGQVLSTEAGKEKIDAGLVAAATDQYAEAIRAAARVGKAAVDADVADRLAALDERAADLLTRFVGELLERAVPSAKKRASIKDWAIERFLELASEYEHPGAQVH